MHRRRTSATRRRRDLLRPLRNRQDHPLGRPARHLIGATSTGGRTTASSTRGRLLREGDQPLAPRRSLRSSRRPHLRDDPRERVLDERGVVDFDDSSKTENTRGATSRADYERPARQACGPSPSVVFLTADAFGILPPIARLTRDQAMFYFLSGSTASSPGPRSASRSRNRPSRLLRRAFCRSRPRSTRACSATGPTSTAPRSGSSTRAGPAGRTARASGCPSGRPARSSRRRCQASSTTSSPN